MNILVIGTTDRSGGAAKVAQQIRSGFEALGHTVTLFVADKKTEDPNVKTIPRKKWQKILGFLFGTDWFISTDWILDTSEFHAADIVHCHNLHGRFFNLRTLQKMSQKKPVVWTLHDEWAITPHCALTMQGVEMKDGLYVCPSIDIPPRLLWNNSVKLTEYKVRIYKTSKLHLVVPSKWLYDRVQRTVLAQQDIQHIPNGVDTEVFKPIDKVLARSSLGLPQDKKIVLFLADAGKENPWKGWVYTENLVKQYAANADVLLVCVGNHELKEPSGNVLYKGYTKDEEELALYYNAADVLLFTSVAENFPLVVLEAMSCGLPVISFDVGGVKEVVSHKETGFIASYEDINDLAKGMDWILSLNFEEKELMRRRSREKIIERYSLPIIQQAYIRYFEKLLHQWL